MMSHRHATRALSVVLQSANTNTNNMRAQPALRLERLFLKNGILSGFYTACMEVHSISPVKIVEYYYELRNKIDLPLVC